MHRPSITSGTAEAVVKDTAGLQADSPTSLNTCSIHGVAISSPRPLHLHQRCCRNQSLLRGHPKEAERPSSSQDLDALPNRGTCS